MVPFDQRGPGRAASVSISPALPQGVYYLAVRTSSLRHPVHIACATPDNPIFTLRCDHPLVMIRLPSVVALVLVTSGCAAERPASVAVRLNLDEIAAATAERDATRPGFTSLTTAAPRIKH